ncbi:MAG: hypothetical protein RL701_7314 [Pseudomonadota bacterium]
MNSEQRVVTGLSWAELRTVVGGSDFERIRRHVEQLRRHGQVDRLLARQEQLVGQLSALAPSQHRAASPRYSRVESQLRVTQSRLRKLVLARL